MSEQKRKAQVIICKCGVMFAASVEPHCYTELVWQRDLRKYVKAGCTVDLIYTDLVKFEQCKCNKTEVDELQEKLF